MRRIMEAAVYDKEKKAQLKLLDDIGAMKHRDAVKRAQKIKHRKR